GCFKTSEAADGYNGTALFPGANAMPIQLVDLKATVEECAAFCADSSADLFGLFYLFECRCIYTTSVPPVNCKLREDDE
ncbi:unnamed protein product, partial [Chrysoparadoxa australica]